MTRHLTTLVRQVALPSSSNRKFLYRYLGHVKRWDVTPGSTVTYGQRLCTINWEGHRTETTAEVTGRVRRILVQPRELLSADTVIIELETDNK